MEEYRLKFRHEEESLEKLHEQKSSVKEQVEDEKAREIIQALTDENFGNESQRKRFVDLITSLFNIPNKDARKFIKNLGKACTTIGSDMLDTEEAEEAEEEIEELEDMPDEEDLYAGEIEESCGEDHEEDEKKMKKYKREE